SSVRPFPINENTIAALRDFGMLTLSEIRRKPALERSEFEDLLLQAVRWFGGAHRQRAPEDRLLNLTTAVETLLVPPGRSVTRELTEGVAFVIGQDAASRRAIREQMTRLYRIRSAVTHGNA